MDRKKPTKARKAFIDDPAEDSIIDEQVSIKEPGNDETEYLAQDEWDASFEDEQNNQDYDNIEECNMEVNISVPNWWWIW